MFKSRLFLQAWVAAAGGAMEGKRQRHLSGQSTHIVPD